MALVPSRQAKRSVTQMRVVTHEPWQRWLLAGAVALTCTAGVAGGFWLGGAKAALDQTYLSSLESAQSANMLEIGRLKDQIVEAGLTREVDQQTAQALRESIKGLRDEIAALTEEVTFYKSLMAPSSLPRGLQLAEFELIPTGETNQFTFHLLLTQIESRRDWIQGDVDLRVHGRGEQVLSLTEIAAGDNYPLKFRFRYFQDLSGIITLPVDFEPESVEVTARRRGANSADLKKVFVWTVAEAANREFRS